VAVVGVFFGGALAIVIELGLQPGEPVKQVVALGLQLLQLVGRLGRGRRRLGGGPPFLKDIRRIGRRQLVLPHRSCLSPVQLLGFHLSFLLSLFFVLLTEAYVRLSFALAYYSTWSLDWVFHGFSFSSLSKSCAIYEPAVIVC